MRSIVFVICALLSVQFCAADLPADQRSVVVEVLQQIPNWKDDGADPCATHQTGSPWQSVVCANNGTTVKSLNVAYRQMHGTIPANIGVLSDLVALSMNDNLITGEIPPSLATLKKLSNLDLSSNALTGPLPNQGDYSVCELVNLTSLNVDSNQLSGTLPSCLGKLKAVEQLILSNNQFTGVIPESFTSLKAMKVCYLNNNQLVGEIPADLNKLQLLGEIDMSSNKFGGSLPDLSKMDKLFTFWAHNNSLTGSLSASGFETLTNLARLQLNDNELTGHIPDTLCNLPNLFDLDLHNNRLQSTIPPCLGTDSLMTLDVSLNANVECVGVYVTKMMKVWNVAGTCCKCAVSGDESTTCDSTCANGGGSGNGGFVDNHKAGIMGSILVLVAIAIGLSVWYVRRRNNQDKQPLLRSTQFSSIA